MNLSEIETAIEWAAMEGWNPGLNDGICFFKTDPHGFFLAEENGKICGVISAVKYKNNFGFIGFYIVEPSRRGGAAGYALAVHALNYLKECNIGLDGVLDRVSNYERIGFKFFYKNIRNEGIIDVDCSDSNDIVEIEKASFWDILNIDRECFPSDRSEFLKCWLAMPNLKAYTRLDDGAVLGWGAVRKCRKGYKIGPLFADDSETAEMLFLKLCEDTAPEPVFFDTPEINKNAVDLAKKYGMKESFATVRMYSKGDPGINVQKIYGVTSFELG